MLTISNGPTFKGFKSYIGLFAAIVAVAMGIPALSNVDILSFFMFLCIAFFGVVLFMAIHGVQIDTGSKRIRPYSDYLLFKVGRWNAIEKDPKLVIGFYSGVHATKAGAMTIGEARRILSFDISLESKTNILIKECPKYKDALKLSEEIANYISCPVINKIPVTYRR